MTTTELASLKAIDGNIANWIRRNNTTSVALAERLNITPSSLSGKRNGKTEWKLSEILELMELLDCDFNTLIS